MDSVFLAKTTGTTQMVAGKKCRGDPGRFDGQDAGDRLVDKSAGKFLADGIHQDRVDLMIEKTVNLEDVAGEYLAIPDDPVFEYLHQ